MKLAKQIGAAWKNLSVSKKLYTVIGVMATLVAAELFTLLFVMDVLSAVRALVGGESSWSKAQKDAVFEIQNYAATGDEKYYQAFLKNLEVPLGDHRARVEMEKPDMNMAVVTQGFLTGRVHPKDIEPTVRLIRRFHQVSYMKRTIEIWKRGDDLVLRLAAVGEQMHELFTQKKRPNSYEVRQLVGVFSEINSELTVLENEFSFTLGEASRWLEYRLSWIVLVIAFTVEGTGLLLTLSFTRGLNRTLEELNDAAVVIGKGDFTKTVPVRSGDELGQLAASINKMAANLRIVKNEQQQAEEANQIKSLFLANMSHEIRTPLGAILGFVDLLGDPNLPPDERAKFTEIVKRTGATLATIINDILDISKVEAGKLEIHKAPSSLKGLLGDLRRLLELRCENKGIYLKFEPLGEVPDMIVTDANRLRQILMNIIGNAIKFTERGGISVRYWAEKTHLYFSIKDTGIGISAEEMNKLFKPFSQVDLSIRKAHSGTGLGLILSRKLAKLLGGNVILDESVPGHGSTFLVRVALELPTATLKFVANERKQPARQERRLDGVRVLVVDDAPDNQLLIKQFLLKSGAVVELAPNGLVGMNMALADGFDVVLMDMQMPVMDGYTATRLLRDKNYSKPVIALTAHAMKEDLEKCRSAGCDEVLTKPVERLHLVSAIYDRLEKSSGMVVNFPTDRTPPPESRA